MKHYELLALISGASEEETEQAKQTIRGILEKQHATISKQDVWERRKLAYPVQKNRQGIYLIFTFDVEPANIGALDQAMGLEKMVLRHQIVIAYQKTAKELEQEARQKARAEQALRPEEEKTPAPAISKEELDEKLAEILTDDMVK